MNSRVYILDVGLTKVGDHWKSSIQELAYESAKGLLHRNSRSIPFDGLVVANALSEISSSQQNLGPLIADALQLDNVEAIEVEAAGASGAAAVHVASKMLSSEHWKKCLVIGVEKMRDLEPSKITLAQALSEQAEYTHFFGMSLASLNALLARLYMSEYGTTRDQLSSFPVIAHKNSSTCEHAQFRKKFSRDDVSRSEIVSDPLRVLDCAPVGDGSAAIILASGEEMDAQQRRNSVEIVTSESASGRVNFFERDDMLEFMSTKKAADRAFLKTGLSIDDIDIFEIHDAYSVGAALICEALGLSKRGEACKDAVSGKFDLNGQFPISTFGGMKGRGYPVGAAGVYQFCEAFMQLKEKAGFNQVPNARRALIQTMSGIDSSCFIHILSTQHKG
jgi:acetyl-CoA C-acetyltransferase